MDAGDDADQKVKRTLSVAARLRVVDDQDLPIRPDDREPLRSKNEGADERMVVTEDGRSRDVDIVPCPQTPELVAAHGKLAHELDETRIVYVRADQRAKPGGSSVGEALPVVDGLAQFGIQEHGPHQIDAGMEDRRQS
jgi:hypothetical protein